MSEWKGHREKKRWETSKGDWEMKHLALSDVLQLWLFPNCLPCLIRMLELWGKGLTVLLTAVFPVPKWVWNLVLLNKRIHEKSIILLFFFVFYYYYFFYCSGFCHTLKWNSRGFTSVPHPDPPSHLPLHKSLLSF